MRISGKKLECLRQHFANEVVFYCGALGLKPDDFEFRMDVAKGVLSIAVLFGDDFCYRERVRVGSIQPRFQQHLLASFKSEVDKVFKGTLEPLVEAA